MEIPATLKGIVEDAQHEDTMVLISGWERAVELSREMVSHLSQLATPL